MFLEKTLLKTMFPEMNSLTTQALMRLTLHLIQTLPYLQPGSNPIIDPKEHPCVPRLHKMSIKTQNSFFV